MIDVRKIRTISDRCANFTRTANREFPLQSQPIARRNTSEMNGMGPDQQCMARQHGEIVRLPPQALFGLFKEIGTQFMFRRNAVVDGVLFTLVE